MMESLGPLPGAQIFLDMHADNTVCWKFTIIMVIFQYLAFCRIGEDIQRSNEKIEKKGPIANI